MRHVTLARSVAVATLAVALSTAAAQQPATTAFTYQGRLQDGAAPANSMYDFQFKLFDALTAGNQVGSTVVVSGVQVTGGLFTVNLDFGAQFNSQARWLHIGIRPAGGGAFTALVPRQPLAAVPVADGLVLPMSATTTATTPGISVTATGLNGTGLYGECDNGAFAYGVQGYSTSGYGVVGNATNGGTGGYFTTDSGIGMQANSTSNHGVYGKNGAGSGRHPLFNYGTGVWGDTDNGNGVAGTSGTAFGVYGLSVSLSGMNSPDVAGVVGESHNHLGVVGLSANSIGVSGYSGSNHGILGRNGAGSGIAPLYGFTGGVWGDSDNGHGLIGTSGTGFGVYGAFGTPSMISPSGSGVVGDSLSGTGVAGLSGSNVGVYGQSTAGKGVLGLSSGDSAVSGVQGGGSGVASPGIAGVLGDSHDSSGVVGLSNMGDGVHGVSNSGYGVHGVGLSTSASGGVLGVLHGPSLVIGGLAGVYGDSNNGDGVVGTSSNAGALTAIGVVGATNNASGWGMWAVNLGGGTALVASTTAGHDAGEFGGNVSVGGTLSKGGGSFKIDHPLDPENKFLYHSFVESPDMMDIYNGTATTDAKGYATVTMPDWFQALNRDFRYQLTVIDSADADDFVQTKVVREIRDNRFTLRTSKPNTKVSWQVTGIRHDAFAEAHRIPVEEYKPDSDRGMFLYPLEAGRPPEQGIMQRKTAEALRQRTLPSLAPDDRLADHPRIDPGPPYAAARP